MSVRVFLEAHDIWFFRTSRPFGSAQAAASDGEPYLIPPGSVAFGALRTALGQRHNVNWEDFRQAWSSGGVPTGWFARLGPPALAANSTWPTEAVRLLGCLPARIKNQRIEPLFPLPSFVLKERTKEQYVVALPLGEAENSSATALRAVLPPANFDGKSTSLLIDESTLALLMKGDGAAGVQNVVSPDQLAEVEPRIGIAREYASRTVKTGFLYSQQTHRWTSRVAFADPKSDQPTYGLVAILDGVEVSELPKRLALRLGGEGRSAWASVEPTTGWFTDAQRRQSVRQAIEKKRGWWLALGTAALFRGGWQPSWIVGDAVTSFRANRNGLDLGQFVGLVGDTPRAQSGWDLANNCPRPVRRMIPEGTTYFFKLDDAAGPDVLDALLALQGTCIADELAHAGAGLAFIGAWDGRSTR